MELISLSDGSNSFRVRVLGRRSPGVLHLHDLLDAEVLVTSGFVSGRLAMGLWPSDVEGWSRALERLAAGKDIHWRNDGRSPAISIQPRNEEHETVTVRVEDLTASHVRVFIPLRLEGDWISGQRRLLRQVRQEWPSEVLESSWGVYEWRR